MLNLIGVILIKITIINFFVFHFDLILYGGLLRDEGRSSIYACSTLGAVIFCQ